ncbi:Translation initiation factor IF-2 [metagenome]|uniref:Translation initiation factor IF-2 n=1 Tax=metagenome TaxID=256318 RepID=A0A2P2BWI1_9ZZZZ
MTAVELPMDLTPLDGGFSGETFSAEVAGQRVVVRIYAGRSRARGPSAVDIDAAVLRWMRGIVPVPEVLEVRRPAGDLPALLVTELVPGRRGDQVLAGLDPVRRAELGFNLGRVLDRLSHVPTLLPGRFAGPSLGIEPFPFDDGLPGWVDAHAAAMTTWSDTDLTALARHADRAQDLLDTVGRTCLVHGDLNPKNVLIDPDSLDVTAVLDWEFAHSGTPFADLGNLLRFEADEGFLDGVLNGLAVPPSGRHGRQRTLELARAADLAALVDLTARDHDPSLRNPVTSAAHRRLLDLARSQPAAG